MIKVRKIKKLLEFSRLLNSTLSIHEVKNRAIQACMELFNCEAGSLLLYNPENQELFFDVALGEKGEKVKVIRLKLGQGIAGTVAQNKKSEIINKVQEDPRFYKWADETSGFKTINMLCIPVLYKEELLGVLQALNKRNKKRYLPFNKTDLEVGEALSAQIAVALANAKMYEDLCKTLYKIIEER